MVYVRCMSRPITPLLAVDCIVFDAEDRLLLVRRRNPPFKGRYALPGGFVEVGETVEEACRRELFEETGIRVKRLTHVGIYSDPHRDPRGHSVSVAFMGRVTRTTPKAGSDAAAAEWVVPSGNLRLAFDHNQILADALRVLKAEKMGKRKSP
jgi:8-oxo-dGTP diphosphatase